MFKLQVKTEKKKQVIDITENIKDITKKSKITDGICSLFVLHTTASLTTADLDPGTDLDMLDSFETIIPHLPFRHPHNPEHVPDHILSSIIGASLIVPFEKGILTLGIWQRIVLIEFDGPRERNINALVIKSQ